MGIQVEDIYKSFGSPPTEVLKNITLTIDDGEFVSIVGRSGSGKSTLLYLLSTLDEPTSGLVAIDGKKITNMPEAELHRFRNLNMGFIFQFHYLLPELTALENILMPALKSKQTESRRPQALALMEEFGIMDKVNRLPRELSGGEQQRVAIARALVMEPRYLFADEPTGNLDSTNGDVVMKIIQRINEEKRTTVVLVTHDSDYASMARRQIHLTDGRVD